MTKDADITVAPIKIVLNIVSPPSAIIVPTNVDVFLNDVLGIHARLAKAERKHFRVLGGDATWREVDSLEETARGAGGFGSTGHG